VSRKGLVPKAGRNKPGRLDVLEKAVQRAPAAFGVGSRGCTAPVDIGRGSAETAQEVSNRGSPGDRLPKNRRPARGQRAWSTSHRLLGSFG